MRPSAASTLAEKLMVMLRDGRKIIGTMRSFDQFANVVLEHAFERVIVGKKFADVPLGLYVIRGENVVLLGQLVSWQQQSHTILCTQRITGSMAIVPALSQWIDPVPLTWLNDTYQLVASTCRMMQKSVTRQRTCWSALRWKTFWSSSSSTMRITN